MAAFYRPELTFLVKGNLNISLQDLFLISYEKGKQRLLFKLVLV
jgi:hypothetical protein